MATCTICCDVYNKSTRKPVACPKCAEDFCTSCIEQYLLLSVKNPDCMSCKHPWDREFLAGVMSKSFISKDLKSHREDILFDREKALLPASQGLAQNYKIAKELEADMAVYKDTLKETKRLLAEIEDALANKRTRLYELKSKAIKFTEASKAVVIIARHQFYPYIFLWYQHS